MKTLWALPFAMSIVGSSVGCRSVPSTAHGDDAPKGSTHTTTTTTSAPVGKNDEATAHAVGTDPGHVGHGTALSPKVAGDELAIFAAGCFWGVESTFRAVPGVVATAVGYTGGRTTEPTYEQVCTHTTGHAEAVLVEFDPKKVSYAQLLDVFFKSHDPTQLNAQGPDVGDQYRSAIFTFDDAQAKAAKASRATYQKQTSDPIVTLVVPIAPFWVAEGYHQQWHEKTGTEGCPTGKSPFGGEGT
jgi:peptide-methionine (S)-S-oxide reductase